MQELKILQDVYQTILQEAADSPIREICGLLYGRTNYDDGRIGSYYISIANISASPNRFHMDPQGLIETLFKMNREHDVQLISIVHSHPFGFSRFSPSREDLRTHWSADIWSSIVYRDYDGWQMAAFSMKTDGFTQIPVKVVDHAKYLFEI